MKAVGGRLAGLRIAHLIESDGPGGAERVVAQLARGMQAAGAENVVFLPADGEGWLAAQLEGSGVAVEHFRLRGPFSPACVRSLADALRRRRVDLAHSHEFSLAVYGAWAAWRAGVPHVIAMHGGRYYAARLRRRLALRSAVALSARTVGVSADSARRIGRDLGLPAGRILTIPNGVPCAPAARPTLREELGLRAQDPLLVSIGNLYPVKGHVLLVEALALLARRHPTLHVAIGGRGEQEETLRARARQHGLADRVHLLGLRADVAALLAAADVFVLPSLSEGLPLALLEAMLAGRPIVASDVGEIAAALGQGDAGVLVPPGDARVLAAALDCMLRDPAAASELGARAARRAAAEYDESRMVSRWAALYEQVLADARPRAPAAAHVRIGSA